MKRMLILSALVLFACATAAVASPVISVDSPTYTASVQTAGAVVAHMFTITNAGDQILSITGVLPSCGCTTATLSKWDLAPGESIGLLVSVNTTGFAGTVDRTVTVKSTDPKTPSLVLRVSVTILAAGQAQVPQITVAEFQKRFYFLIDVRTPEEYAGGHLFGAVNIPLSEFQTDLAKWTPRLPKDVPIIVQGTVDSRGLEAARTLLDAGFANVLNLVGGITEWTNVFGPQYLFGLE